MAFEPFDLKGHLTLCREKTTAELLNLFKSLRSANLAELTSMSLKPADFARRGSHPSLGPVTLWQASGDMGGARSQSRCSGLQEARLSRLLSRSMESLPLHSGTTCTR